MFSLILFFAVFVWLFRYVRLIVNCISYWTYKPIAPSKSPTFFADDVTIILPSVANDPKEFQGLETTLRTCLQTDPHEVLLVTSDDYLKPIEDLAKSISDKKIRVLSISQANKRRQMCRAIPEVTTRITVFADDDVIWPPKVLQWILAAFEDPKMGGVGTCQTLKRSADRNAWSFLGAAYLWRRNFDCFACLNVDGGLPCLSGRTVGYRTSILQDEAFTHSFTHEEWRTCQLNADDDNFITRWMYSHGWKIWMQFHKECEVQTTLENSPRYLSQCLRWVRSNWRSNLTSMFIERHYWISQPWSTYSVLQTTITAWSFMWDVGMMTLWYFAAYDWSSQHWKALWVFLLTWTFLFSKTVKLWGHYIRYPVDVMYIPLYIAFGYFHGAIKLMGLLTLNETTWGSRDSADAHDGVRMIKLPAYGSTEPDGRRSETFDTLENDDRLPAYDPRADEVSATQPLLVPVMANTLQTKHTTLAKTTTPLSRTFTNDDLIV